MLRTVYIFNECLCFYLIDINIKSKANINLQQILVFIFNKYVYIIKYVFLGKLFKLKNLNIFN